MRKILFAVLFIFIFTSGLVYGADSYCKFELTPSLTLAGKNDKNKP